MENKIYNANLYAAFMEGKATKDEMRTVMKQMMRDSRLIMDLNLAGSVNEKFKTNQRKWKKKTCFII